MAGEVSLNCQVGRERMTVTGSSQLAYVLVEARTSDQGTAGAQTRMPVNLALVLDHSGSMRGQKIRAVKDAVKLVIDQMAPSDIVSVVIFDDNVQVVVPAQPVRDRELLKAAVEGIKDGGGTAMSLGMNIGLTELRKYASPQTVNRMILLTDGATYGDVDRCRRIADDAGAAGVGIYPMGIGADWQEDLLDNIGQRSSGMPAEFIRRPEDAVALFQAQLQSAEAVGVTNAQLTLRLSGGVAPKRAVKVLPVISELAQDTLSDREVVVHLGDLERGSPQAVLIDLMVENRPAGVFRIAQAELSYDAPNGGGQEKVRADAVVTFTNDPVAPEEANALVMNYAEKANAHRLVTRVLDEYKKTGKVTTRLHPNVTRVLDPETQRALDQLAAGGAVSAEDVKSISNKTRKLTQRFD
ncbi:MAG TPA: VWA domain-containing protein [Ktedonobacterales bacterium]|nr:VWA domain-containing protein [Ktedonobacterales bacterium]